MLGAPPAPYFRMSPLLLLTYAIQIACCVHVVRTGRPLYWVFILLVFPFLSAIVYFIAEVLPELRHHPSARRTTSVKTSSYSFPSSACHSRKSYFPASDVTSTVSPVGTRFSSFQ